MAEGQNAASSPGARTPATASAAPASPAPASPAPEPPLGSGPAVLPEPAEKALQALALGPGDRLAIRLERLAIFGLLALAQVSFAVLAGWGLLALLERSPDDEALRPWLLGAAGVAAAFALVSSARLVRREPGSEPDEVLLYPDRVETFRRDGAPAPAQVARFFFRQLDEVELQRGPRGEVVRVALEDDKERVLTLARPWRLEAIVDHVARASVPGILARYRGLLELGDELELRSVGRFQERRLRSEGFSGSYCYAASVLFLARFLVDTARFGTLPFDTLDLPIFFVFVAFGLGLQWESKRGLRSLGLVLTREGVRSLEEPVAAVRPWRDVRAERVPGGIRLEASGRPALLYSDRGSCARVLGEVLLELVKGLAAESAPVAASA